MTTVTHRFLTTAWRLKWSDRLSNSVDWKLLLFLVLMLNVKLPVKLFALVLIYCLQPDFRFGFKWNDSRLPLFYPVIIALALFGSIATGELLAGNYPFTVAAGILFWAAALLASHQMMLFVENKNVQVIYQTLVVFFLINAAFSFTELLYIIFDSGSVNPYRYQGEFQKYFINTGDYIKGISFDTSTTNASINAFGLLFFLFRKNYLMVLVCMATLLLASSNLINVLLLAVLILIFIFWSNAAQKSMIVCCTALLVLFMVKITPQNTDYVAAIMRKLGLMAPAVVVPSSSAMKVSSEENNNQMQIAKQKLEAAQVLLADKMAIIGEKPPAESVNERYVIPGDSIHTPAFQHRDDTAATRLQMIDFFQNNYRQDHEFLITKKPGKLIAAGQTVRHFKQHPEEILTGAGIGNFSSKLAFRATGLQIAGSYPASLIYIAPEFQHNHLALYLFYFTRPEGQHSIVHHPGSVYDQMAAEYGLAGALAFGFFYIGFFLKRFRQLSYGIPLTVLLLGIFFSDYWFEQLSIVVLFELLMFLDLKQIRMK